MQGRLAIAIQGRSLPKTVPFLVEEGGIGVHELIQGGKSETRVPRGWESCFEVCCRVCVDHWKSSEARERGAVFSVVQWMSGTHNGSEALLPLLQSIEETLPSLLLRNSEELRASATEAAIASTSGSITPPLSSTASIPSVLHDTAGWAGVEGGILCFASLLFGSQVDPTSSPLRRSLLQRILLPNHHSRKEKDDGDGEVGVEEGEEEGEGFCVLDAAVDHRNRFVREAVCVLLQGLMLEEGVEFGKVVLCALLKLQHDAWSPVRRAATHAFAPLAQSLPAVHKELIPPLYFNSFYPADGVRSATSSIWGILDPRFHPSIDATHSQYPSHFPSLHWSACLDWCAQAIHTSNHSIRVCACEAAAELLQRTPKTSSLHPPPLPPLAVFTPFLEASQEDDAAHVRRAALQAVGAAIRASLLPPDVVTKTLQAWAATFTKPTTEPRQLVATATAWRAACREVGEREEGSEESKEGKEVMSGEAGGGGGGGGGDSGGSGGGGGGDLIASAFARARAKRGRSSPASSTHSTASSLSFALPSPSLHPSSADAFHEGIAFVLAMEEGDGIVDGIRKDERLGRGVLLWACLGSARVREYGVVARDRIIKLLTTHACLSPCTNPSISSEAVQLTCAGFAILTPALSKSQLRPALETFLPTIVAALPKPNCTTAALHALRALSNIFGNKILLARLSPDQVEIASRYLGPSPPPKV